MPTVQLVRLGPYVVLVGRGTMGAMPRTLCPACHGHGVIVTGVAYGSITHSPEGAPKVAVTGTLPQEMPCKTCDGTGWLDGLQPPV